MKKFYSVWGIGYSNEKLTGIEVDFGRASSKKAAIAKFNKAVEDYSTKRAAFDNFALMRNDYLLIQIERNEEDDDGNVECVDVIKEIKVFNPDNVVKRKVVCVIEVDDDTAQELDLGTLDYLEKLLEPVGHIEMTEARVLDDGDPQDAKALKHVESIFKEEF